MRTKRKIADISGRVWLLSFLVGILTLGSFSFASEGSNSEDLLEQAFWPTIINDAIVGGDSIGTTKRSVGNYVLKDGVEIDVDAFNFKANAQLKEIKEEKDGLLIEIDEYKKRNQWDYLLSGTMLEYLNGGEDFSAKLWEYNQLTLQEQKINDDKTRLGNVQIKKRPPLVIAITKFLLRMTMVLAVTMVIYNGIMYIVKSSKGENAKDVLMNLVYIGAGILLALLSVVIIRLVSSIGTSSLNTII